MQVISQDGVDVVLMFKPERPAISAASLCGGRTDTPVANGPTKNPTTTGTHSEGR